MIFREAPRERAPARVFLGLGSNLGDRESLLSRARALLAALPGTTLSAQSGLYETAPVGGPDQDDFLNQVVETRRLELLTLSLQRRCSAS